MGRTSGVNGEMIGPTREKEVETLGDWAIEERVREKRRNEWAEGEWTNRRRVCEFGGGAASELIWHTNTAGCRGLHRLARERGE